jgi:hypothetical protein
MLLLSIISRKKHDTYKSNTPWPSDPFNNKKNLKLLVVVTNIPQDIGVVIIQLQLNFIYAAEHVDAQP